MEINIVNKSNNSLYEYNSLLDTGMDLRAYLDQPVVLHLFERKIIPAGLYIELPEEYEAQIKSRSGLAIKHGISIVNAPGTIDADYRGDRMRWQETDDLNASGRGEGGFGNTGRE